MTKISTTLPRSPMKQIAALDSDVEHSLRELAPFVDKINISDDKQNYLYALAWHSLPNDSYPHSVRKMARTACTRGVRVRSIID